MRQKKRKDDEVKYVDTRACLSLSLKHRIDRSISNRMKEKSKERDEIARNTTSPHPSRTRARAREREKGVQY